MRARQLNAFAASQSVGLNHIRAKLFEIFENAVSGMKNLVLRISWNSILRKQVASEGFAGFQSGEGLDRPNAGDSQFLQRIHNAFCQRLLGADDDKIGFFFLRPLQNILSGLPALPLGKLEQRLGDARAFEQTSFDCAGTSVLAYDGCFQIVSSHRVWLKNDRWKGLGQ